MSATAIIDFDKNKWANVFDDVLVLPLAHHGVKRRGNDRSSEGMKTAGIKDSTRKLQFMTAHHKESDRNKGTTGSSARNRKACPRITL